jgi:hypothetical protein
MTGFVVENIWANTKISKLYCVSKGIAIIYNVDDVQVTSFKGKKLI